MSTITHAARRGRRVLGLLAAALAGCGAFAASGRAADLPEQAELRPALDSDLFFNEVRVGGFYHGIGNPERNTADFNAELLTRKLFTIDDPNWSWFAPRLHVGGNVSTAGRTNDGYAGLTWTWNDVLFKHAFAEYSFGGSANDGYTGRYAPYTRAKLGCTVLFRESGSIGYHLTEHVSVMATIEHISNGNLCEENRGLTSAGLRLGYSF